MEPSFKQILFSFCLLFSLELNDVWCVHTVYIIHTAGCEMVCDHSVLTDVTHTEHWHHDSVTLKNLENVKITINHTHTHGSCGHESCMTACSVCVQKSFTFHPPDWWLQHETDFSVRTNSLTSLTVTANYIFHQTVLMGFNLTFALFLLLLAR